MKTGMTNGCEDLSGECDFDAESGGLDQASCRPGVHMGFVDVACSMRLIVRLGRSFVFASCRF